VSGRTKQFSIDGPVPLGGLGRRTNAAGRLAGAPALTQGVEIPKTFDTQHAATRPSMQIRQSSPSTVHSKHAGFQRYDIPYIDEVAYPIFRTRRSYPGMFSLEKVSAGLHTNVIVHMLLLSHSLRGSARASIKLGVYDLSLLRTTRFRFTHADGTTRPMQCCPLTGATP
jgi:hypothetical protein